jgi:hypothetical protein
MNAGLLSLIALVMMACHQQHADPSSMTVTSDDPAPGRPTAEQVGPTESRTTHARADLSPAVRELLRGGMERHGDSMRDLLSSSLTLQYGLLAQRARWMSAERKIPRPPPAEDDHALDRFFDMQDDLYRDVAALASASEREDDEAIARAYGQLAGTCIRCHSLYLPAIDNGRDPD